MKLWVPENSNFIEDTQWMINTFQRAPRLEIIFSKAEDVLQSQVLLELNKLNEKIVTSGAKDEKWEDVCFK